MRITTASTIASRGQRFHAALMIAGLLFCPPVVVAQSIDLAALDGTDGFVIQGVDAGDRTGFFLSGAGDFNGDGNSDLIIGAPFADGPANSRPDAGGAFLVFGDNSGFPAALDLSLLDGTIGFAIHGIDSNDLTGVAVGPAGDINGDGYDDVAIGARDADGPANGRPNSGETTVIFGGPGPFAAEFDLTAINGTNGFVLTGVDAGDRSGSAVSSTGDLDGDGFSDLAIGAFTSNGEGNLSAAAGEVSVVFGTATPFPPSFDLASLNGVNGFTLFGIDPGDGCGRSATGAGDVNGDGLDDLLIGARYADGPGNTRSYAGDSYVVFGRKTAFAASMNASSLDGTNGFALYGPEAGDRTGFSLSGVGDVDQDGLGDLLICGRFADGPANSRLDAGENYLVYGRDTGFGSALDLGLLAGLDGFTIFGAEADDRLGISVSGVGDYDGDGFADLFMGASFGDGPGNARLNCGESFMVFGSESDSSPTLDLADLGNIRGFQLFGPDDQDRAGWAVTNTGDFDGDGLSDLAIGAYLADGPSNSRSEAGDCFVVFSMDAATSGTFSSYLIQDAATPKPVGALGNGSDFSNPPSRCWIGFDGGDSGSGTASLQTVSIFRTDAPIQNLSSTAPVYWELNTNRVGWSAAEVTFKYTDSEVSSLIENQLVLFKAETLGGPWTPLPTVIDTNKNTLSAVVDSFSFFAISTAASSVESWQEVKY